ncbi:hypothetical protein Tdes44962_MAKER05824 [Teratosphaeria destructans]|uniref:Uncharacterized protein n=1 Tax=Teratosphaeria destructans TaxID=418781 RepID=A0A9W7SIX6_9PEZI|nr:hypothetical protein Tdes44962_MAKER05824 [Teratosphaeria destructans]
MARGSQVSTLGLVTQKIDTILPKSHSGLAGDHVSMIAAYLNRLKTSDRLILHVRELELRSSVREHDAMRRELLARPRRNG